MGLGRTDFSRNMSLAVANAAEDMETDAMSNDFGRRDDATLFCRWSLEC